MVRLLSGDYQWLLSVEFYCVSTMWRRGCEDEVSNDEEKQIVCRCTANGACG